MPDRPIRRPEAPTAAPDSQRTAADMTTAPATNGSTTRPDRPATVGGQVRSAALATLVARAWPPSSRACCVSGPPAAAGAAVGFGMVLVFFGTGAVVVNAVATVSPVASLMVAMLTYTLEVVLVALVFAALDGSGALDGAVDRTWAGGRRDRRDPGLVGVPHHLRDPLADASLRPPRAGPRRAPPTAGRSSAR